MPECLPLRIAGVELQLLADRAVYWPARRLLVIADLHLGKGDTFRRHGIAVPSGGTLRDLVRLERLLVTTGAASLLILGDVVHAGMTGSGWRAQWQVWREQWPTLSIMAVRGNHDRALQGDVLGMADVGGQWCCDGLRFVHDMDDGDAPTVAGHVHPVVRVPGELRAVPVFWLRDECRLVLPAFSAFTGGWCVRPARGERLYACNGEHIVALPAP